MHKEADIRKPLILGDKSYHQITEDVCAPVEGKANNLWYMAFTMATIVALWGLGCITYTIGRGIGVWGLNNTHSGLGVGYYKFRLVGWYWSRRNTYFRSTFIVPSEMENGN